MANTFQYDEKVILDALLRFENKSQYTAVGMNPLATKQFASSDPTKAKGQTVQVNIPPQITGNSWTGTGNLSDSTVTETLVPVTIEKFIYVRIPQTALNYQFEVTDQVVQVIKSMADSVMGQAELYVQSKVAAAAAANLLGTAGVEPSTQDHISAVAERIFTNSLEDKPLIGMITPRANRNFINQPFMNNRDYGEVTIPGLERGYLRTIENISMVKSAINGTFTRSLAANDLVGCTTDTPVAGAYTLIIDGITSTTGAIYQGARCTITDDTSGTVYSVAEDATIAANSTTLTFNEPLDASVADGKLLVWQTAHKENYVFDPDALTTCLVPVEESEDTTSFFYNGMGLSIIRGVTSQTDLSRSTIIGGWIGSKALQHERFAIMQG